MAVILVALLIVLILGGLGFAIHVLWWLALAALVIWLLGFAFASGKRSRGHVAVAGITGKPAASRFTRPVSE